MTTLSDLLATPGTAQVIYQTAPDTPPDFVRTAAFSTIDPPLKRAMNAFFKTAEFLDSAPEGTVDLGHECIHLVCHVGLDELRRRGLRI